MMHTSLTSHATDSMNDNALFRKITWRLLPLLFTCFVFNYLARTNVGYAQLEMRDQLGFGDAVFGLGAGIFFIGYSVFEIPSNLMLAKIGVRATLLRIMGLWGIASASMVFVTSPTQYYILRFLIGVFEAGFFPGVMYYFTLWYPSNRRAQAVALFLMAYGAAPILSGPFAALTMTYLDGILSLKGWQWLFITEGLPSILLGIAVFLRLSNTPAQAGWLSENEKSRLQFLLNDEHRSAATDRRHTAVAAVRDYRVWLLGMMAFLITMGVYALSFWQPMMMKSMGLSVMQIGFYSVIPAVVSIILTVIVSRHSDRRRERRWHFAFSALAGAAGLSLTTLYMNSPLSAIICLAISSAGISCALTVLWSVPGMFMSETAAAAGIGVISTIATSAGVVAPVMVGYIKTATGGFTTSLYILSAALVLSGLLMIMALPKKYFFRQYVAA